jgi:hypothetical protein
MRNPIGLSLVAVLAACGGSSASKTFSYATPQPATSAELDAVGAGQSGIADGADFHASPTATTCEALPGLADAMAAPLFEASPMPGTATFVRALNDVATTAMLAAPPSAAMPSAVASAWPAGCITTTASSITYAGCSQSASGLTLTLDGTVSRTAGSVDWSLRLKMTGSIPSTAGDLAVDAGSSLDGSMAFGSGTATGRSSSATRATVSGAGIPSVTAAATTTATVDLAYQTSPFCITGGTIELTRVWTARPLGMPSSPPYDDRGYRFTWSGCGEVAVAHSR